MDHACGPASPRPPAPLEGKRVVISGLIGRPDLNGRVGDAGELDESTGRYVVSVGVERVALRSSNLRLQAAPAGPADATRFDAHSKVTITGLCGRPQLNGQCATVLHWDDVKERYAIKLCATPRTQPSRDAAHQTERYARARRDSTLETLCIRAANLAAVRPEGKPPKWGADMLSAEAQADIDRQRREAEEEACAKSMRDPLGFRR